VDDPTEGAKAFWKAARLTSLAHFQAQAGCLP
jgi:hypothetical protein